MSIAVDTAAGRCLYVQTNRPETPMPRTRIRRRRYDHKENLQIIEALRPRQERLRDVAERLGRTPAAVEQQYQRLLKSYGDPARRRRT